MTGFPNVLTTDLPTDHSTLLVDVDGSQFHVLAEPAGGPPPTDVDAVDFVPTPGTQSTSIQSQRLSDQMPSNAAALGLTNLGSDTTAVLPPNTGNYATTCGGDQNQTLADYATVSGGLGNVASGQASAVGGGTGNTVGAQNGFAAGEGNNVGAGQAVAMGEFCSAQGLQSVAMGRSCTAGTQNSVALGDTCTIGTAGNGNVAVGDHNTIGDGCFGCHACGSQNTIDDGSTACCVEGNSCEVSGTAAHAEGLFCVAAGSAHAEGEFSRAAARASHCSGYGGFAAFDSGRTLCSGPSAATALATTKQVTELVLRGATPGVAPGEDIVLAWGDVDPATKVLGLTDGKAYLFIIEATVLDVTGTLSAALIGKVSVRCTAGVATIAGTSAIESFGDAALVAQVALTFTTSTNELLVHINTSFDAPTVVRAAAECRIVEVG